MGRGSGGVAQTKGKSLTAEQVRAVRVNSYQRIRLAIVNGKNTQNAAKAYRQQLSGASMHSIETQLKKSVDTMAQIQAKRELGPGLDKFEQTASQALGVLSRVEIDALRDRDTHNKYDGAWFDKMVDAANKKARKQYQ